jgi:hypothetical protein
VGPSRAAALDARYQSAETSVSSGVGLNIQKTRRQVAKSVSRTRTTLASQWCGGAVIADDISRLARC